MSNLTEQLQNDLKLIQEVERHTNLYDPRCKDKDSKSRENTWSIIGKKLNLARKYRKEPLTLKQQKEKSILAAEACKNRWKNLRDKYTREKKLMMTEGEESYRNHQWPLIDEMSFLWNFVSHRKNRNSQYGIFNFSRPQFKFKNYSPEDSNSKYYLQPDWMNLSINYNNCDDNSSIKSNFLDPACVLIEEDEALKKNDSEDNSPPRSKLRKLLENKEEDNSDSPNENLTDSSYQPEGLTLIKVPQPLHFMDEEEYFCMSLAASLRRLPKQTSSLLKIKIMQIIYDAQYGENKSL